MSLDIHLKQTKLIKKKFTLADITNALDGYAYGISDVGFILTDLDGDFEDKYIIFYDPKKIGRGFTLQYISSERAIDLNLNVPCTYHDIEDFYECTKRLCKMMGIQKFEHDGEILTLEDIPEKVKYTMNWVGNVLDSFVKDEKFGYTFGAIYPLHVEEKFMKSIMDLDEENKVIAFEEYLHEKQNQDLYYAKARVYKINDERLVGFFTLSEGVDSIFPDEPALPIMSDDLDISDWYIGIVSFDGEPHLEGNIAFNTLKEVLDLSSLPRFDESHFIITLDQKQIEQLRPHFIEI